MAAQEGVMFGKVEGADPPVLAKRVQELANERLADKEAVGDGAGGVEPELQAKLKRLIRCDNVMTRGGRQGAPRLWRFAPRIDRSGRS